MIRELISKQLTSNFVVVLMCSIASSELGVPGAVLRAHTQISSVFEKFGWFMYSTNKKSSTKGIPLWDVINIYK